MTILIVWLLFGIVSAVVASNKGRSGCGWFLLGHFFVDIPRLILSLVAAKNQGKEWKKRPSSQGT